MIKKRWQTLFVGRLFKVRTILMITMLAVVILPLGSLYFLRFYENELVRNTESELIAQAAVISALYRTLIGKQNKDILAPAYTPIPPSLDLSITPILPRRPHAKSTELFADDDAQSAGELMQEILLSAQRFTLAGMRVLDQQGVVVAGKNEVGMSLAHVPEVQKALKGYYVPVIRERVSDEPRPALTSISRGAGIRVFVAFPIIDRGEVYGVVYMSRTPKDVVKHMYDNKWKLIVLIAVLLVVTRLLVVFLSTRISRPIRHLIGETQKVARGEADTVEVLKHPGTYELAQLSESFTDMSKKVNERSNYIREFASHVSHEFKTPLTSLQGTAEILLEHFDDVPEEKRKQFLNNLLEDSQRLQKLVERLLELAKADSMQPTQENVYLLETLQKLENRYQERGLQLAFKNISANLQLPMSEDALETVLINLFENSLQHGANRVEISGSAGLDGIIIKIHDNGNGISAANRERIFTPFFTTRRGSGGTGLGLGIISSLLKNWQASIELGESRKGALFIIRF
jgi:signal transduction histidine kinase